MGGVCHARVVRHRSKTEDGSDRVPAGADELGAAVEDVHLEVVDQEDAGQDLDRLEVVFGKARVRIVSLTLIYGLQLKPNVPNFHLQVDHKGKSLLEEYN